MFDTAIKAGTTSKIVEVTLRDSTTGGGKTGVAHTSVTASYVREGGLRQAVTLTAGSPGDAYSSGKWAEVDAVNCKGLYQIHLPDAAIAAGVAASTITLQASGVIDKHIRIALPAVDLFDAVRQGLTALPNAAANANGGLPILSSSGTTLAYTISTLTSLPVAPTDWFSAAAVSAAAATKIANETEAQIIDETDSEKVLTAITDKIASVNPSLSGLTLAAIASGVWSNVTRTLTAGDNIVLAKGVGVTGFNDLSAAQVNAEADAALADVGVTLTVTGRIDAAISSRLPTSSYTSPPSAVAISAQVASDLVSAHGSGSWTTATSVNVATISAGAITPAAIATGAIDADSLAADALLAIANKVESEIIDETDSEKVLTAITDKIASVNPDLSGLTLAAIASSVWNNGTRTLTAGTNIVLAKGTGVTGLNDLSASEVNAEVDAALADVGVTTTITGRIDAAISSRMASGGSVSFVTPAETAGRPTTLEGMIRRVFEKRHNKRTRNRSTGELKVIGMDGSTVLETSVQSTTGSTDTETQGA